MTRPMTARLTARPARPHAMTRPDPSIDASLRTSQALDRARMVREVVDRAKDLLMAQEASRSRRPSAASRRPAWTPELPW
jgi:hypothetical protein